MIWHMLIILLIFLILTIWFLPEGTTFGYLMGVFIGAAVASLITWFTIKFASRSLSRILISATEFKEEAYESTYDNVRSIWDAVYEKPHNHVSR